MPKHLHFKWALILLCAAMPFCTDAATLTFKYNKTSMTATVTGWTGSEPTGELRIPLQSTNPDDGQKYDVTAISPGVFNNLKKVTSVYIRKNIRKIGDCTGNNVGAARNIYNFENCPNLKTFEVEDGNKYFKNTGAGMLVSADGTMLYRVPDKINAGAEGRINLSSTIELIVDGAFVGNSTIKVLSISKNIESIFGNPGFNYMTALEKFEVDAANEAFEVLSNGALYHKTRNEVVSLLPSSKVSTFTLPTKTELIGTAAFANCTNLKKVVLGSKVYQINDYAFAGSGITEIEIPATVKYGLGESAFENCKSLKKISLKVSGGVIPMNFARGATALTSVKLASVPNTIEDRAFAGCTSLRDFPLYPNVSYGDSVFAGTGFVKVEFLNGDWSYHMCSPHDMFRGCEKLTEIDMSKVKYDEADHSICELADGFASDCHKLTTVIFPEFFESRGVPFANCTGIKKIVVKRFNSWDDNIFYFTESGVYSPDVYINSHEHDISSFMSDNCELSRLLGATDGASLAANIYVDYFSPDPESESGGVWYETDYVIDGCTYYIPGRTSEEYEKAPKKIEMFDIVLEKNSASARGVVRSTRQLDGVVLKGCIFNKNGILNSFQNGIISSTYAYSDIKEVRVVYTVNGVDMETVYPAEVLKTPLGAVDDVTVDEADAPYTVVDLSGVVLTTGVGNPDLSGLSSGVYIVKRASGTTKIIK